MNYQKFSDALFGDGQTEFENPYILFLKASSI